jgi:uncharacterized membrane-anchored protein
MKNKKIILLLFILVIGAQLIVPAKMILNKERVLKTGTAFKFKTIPFDPSDPFRGKYIHLNFEEDKFEIKNKDNWTRNEEVYAIITNNDNGYATIKNVVKEKPSSDIHFITTKVKHVDFYGVTKSITIEYPFERFYMEEFKAKPAEDVYRDSFKIENTTTYALVYIKNGAAVLENVFINNVPIKDAI